MLNSGGGSSSHSGDSYKHLPHPPGTQLHTGGPDNLEGACLFYPEADTLQWALLQVRCIHPVEEPDEPGHLS